MKSVTEYKKKYCLNSKKSLVLSLVLKNWVFMVLLPEENKQRKAIWMCLFHWRKWSHSLFLILKNCWNHCVNVRLI